VPSWISLHDCAAQPVSSPSLHLPALPACSRAGRRTRAPEGHALQLPVVREGDQAARQHGRLRLGLVLKKELALPGHHLLARPTESTLVEGMS